MRIAQRLVIVSIVTLLGGCGAAENETEERQPPPVEDTVFGDTVETLDRARGVEDTVMQHKQELDRRLEQDEASDSQ